MSANRPVRRLNNYYKSNDGFKAWVKNNEEWFKKNPDVFQKMLRDPKMVNLFMEMMVAHSPRIQKRLGRMKRRKR